MTQSITLNLPEPIYQRVARRARQMKRSVEDELLDAVAGSLPELPANWERELAQLAYFTDEELWQSAQSTLPTSDSQHMQQLTQKQQSAGLTNREQKEVNTLLQRFDRTMLVRAQAALLLKQRVHDISALSPNSTAQ